MPLYREIYPSPEPEIYENARREVHLRATRYLLVDAADLESLSTYLLSEQGGYYPHPPGNNGALVRRIKYIPRGKIGGVAELSSYDEAIVEVFYSTDGPRWVNGLAVEEEFSPHNIMVAPPADTYWFGGVRVDADTVTNPVFVIGARHTFTVARSWTYPNDALDYIGMVNANTKYSYFFSFSFPPETVLYSAPTLKSTANFVSGVQYTYTYDHLLNPHNWNKYFHAKGGVGEGDWEYVYTDQACTKIYRRYPKGW